MADILNMRNRHSPVFLMGTDVGRLLDNIAIELVHQAVGCNYQLVAAASVLTRPVLACCL